MDAFGLDETRAPQYVDFNHINDTEDDSFFDDNDTDLDSVVAFSVKQRKTNNKKRESKHRKAKTEAAKHLKEEKDDGVFRFTATPSSSQNQKLRAKKPTYPKKRQSLKKKNVEPTKPQETQKPKVPFRDRAPNTKKGQIYKAPEPNTKPAAAKQKASSRLSSKRLAAFGNPRPAKQMRKTTQPTTPECLKRSLKSTKVVKSSEEIELEHIAELRKQMHAHLKTNKQTMKRVIQGSALKPINIVPKVQPEAKLRVQQETKAKGQKGKNYLKDPAPVAKALPEKTSRRKAVQQPENHTSFMLPESFGVPLRTSTPFGHIKSDLELKKLYNPPNEKIRSVAKALELSSHSGIMFLPKNKDLQSSFCKTDSVMQESRSMCCNLERSMRTLNCSVDPFTVSIHKMSPKELSHYIPDSEIDKLQTNHIKKIQVNDMSVNTSMDSLCIAVKKMSVKELSQYLPSSEIQKLGCENGISPEKQVNHLQKLGVKKLSIVVEKLSAEKITLLCTPKRSERRKKQKNLRESENKQAQPKHTPSKNKAVRGISRAVLDSPLNDVTSTYQNQQPLKKPSYKEDISKTNNMQKWPRSRSASSAKKFLPQTSVRQKARV